ncbi:SAUR family protein [Vigna unguiculata]|uniref:SAUR family protein n=1 Tax=Vigna unguiculata TaxID=3917 RepID=A0A4D6NXT8_VIGUN|nr:SAUR family protein [Vigna unguiculata]
MGFRFPAIRRASFTGSSQSSPKAINIAKGYVAVYVGERMKRFVIPMTYLNQPSFQDLLVKQRKNLDTIIQWVVLQFLAQKMSFCMLPLA